MEPREPFSPSFLPLSPPFPSPSLPLPPPHRRYKSKTLLKLTLLRVVMTHISTDMDISSNEANGNLGTINTIVPSIYYLDILSVT